MTDASNLLAAIDAAGPPAQLKIFTASFATLLATFTLHDPSFTLAEPVLNLVKRPAIEAKAVAAGDATTWKLFDGAGTLILSGNLGKGDGEIRIDFAALLVDMPLGLAELSLLVTGPGTAIASGRISAGRASATGDFPVRLADGALRYVGDVLAQGGKNQLRLNPALVIAPGLKAISAGTTLATSGTVVYSNSNGVSFGLSGQTVTASVNAGALQLSAGTTNVLATQLRLSDSNNVSFGLNGSTVTASAALRLSAGTTSNLASAFTLSNANGVSFGLNAGTVTASIATSLTAIRVSAGTTSNLLSAFTLSNANGVSFGLNNSVVTASVASSLTGINVSAGTASQNLSALTFSDDQNVFWGLSGSTVTANASLAFFGLPGAVNGAAFSFVNQPGLTFSVSSFTYASAGKTKTGAQYTPTLAAFITTESQLGLVSHVGGNSVGSITRLAFSNANNVSWSLSTAAGAATVQASIATSLSNINLSAGTTSQNLSNFVFSNSNGVSFGLSGSTVTASVGGAAAGSISAGTTSVALGQAVFSNSNGISFGLNGSTVTADYARELAKVSVNGATFGPFSVLSFIDAAGGVQWGITTNVAGVARVSGSQPPALTVTAGASSASAVSNIVFTNTNNVGFALSTAAGQVTVRAAASISFSAGTTNVAASQLSFANGNGVSFGLNGSTVTASVAAAGGGGIALAASGSTQTDQTVLFARATQLDGGMAAALVNNVAFAFNTGASSTQIQATALLRVDDNQNVTVTSGNLVTKMIYQNSNGVSFGVATTTNADGRFAQITASVEGVPYDGFWRNFYGMPPSIEGGGVGQWRTDMMHLFPLKDGYGNAPAMSQINTLGILMSGPIIGTSQTGSVSIVVSGALFRSVNSTQLTLVNSFSSSFSTGTVASATRISQIAGFRWWTVHSSQWSSPPVLTDEEVWMGLIFRESGALSLAPGVWCPIPAMNGVGGFRGMWGVQATNNFAARPWPFWGAMSTGGIPGSVAASQMLGKNAAHSSLTAAAFNFAWASQPSIGIFSGFAATN